MLIYNIEFWDYPPTGLPRAYYITRETRFGTAVDGGPFDTLQDAERRLHEMELEDEEAEDAA